MIFRLYHETRGRHVHCRLFAGARDGALGKCGDLCMRVEEFAAFREASAFIEFRPEPAPEGPDPFKVALAWARSVVSNAAASASVDYVRGVLGSVGYHDAARDCASLLAALGKAQRGEA